MSRAAAGVLVLAAMKQELGPLRGLERLGARLSTTGMGPARAAESARRLAPGARLLVSTGCCGALVDDLAPGALVIGDRVLAGGEDAPRSAPAPDPAWTAAATSAAARLGLAHRAGALVTVSRPLLDEASKRACGERAGGLAVDMETAAIAGVAGELGVPYLSVRVVLDGVSEQLPELLDRSRGGSLGALVRHPGQALEVAALVLRLRVITGALARCLEETFRSGPPR